MSSRARGWLYPEGAELEDRRSWGRNPLNACAGTDDSAYAEAGRIAAANAASSLPPPRVERCSASQPLPPVGCAEREGSKPMGGLPFQGAPWGEPSTAPKTRSYITDSELESTLRCEKRGH